MRPFRSILEIPGLRACVQSPPHAAVRQLLRRSGAQNDRQDMCDQWLKHQFARRGAVATATACAACRECSFFQVRIFKLLENCFSTPRALQSEFVDVEERKMILSMPPSELAQRSAVNGLGFGFYQLQVPYENRTARFVTES